MPEFDFGSLKETETESEIKTQTPKAKKPPKKKESSQKGKIQMDKSPKGSHEIELRPSKETSIVDFLIQDIKTLKEKIEKIEQKKEPKDLPEEVYIDLWLVLRSELSKWKNKSDSMLNSTNHIITYFNIDLSKNPLKELKKGSE